MSNRRRGVGPGAGHGGGGVGGGEVVAAGGRVGFRAALAGVAGLGDAAVAGTGGGFDGGGGGGGVHHGGGLVELLDVVVLVLLGTDGFLAALHAALLLHLLSLLHPARKHHKCLPSAA